MASTKLREGGYRAELDDAERASRDQIMALQTQRLAWSLSHAYDNVAHYRRAFDKAGVHPSDFKALADLSKFPFTVKTDLRDNYPFSMFAVPREKLVRVHASSGTTGKPIVVGYTRADIEMWSDVMARSIRAAGGRSGMIMHNAYGYGLFTGGLGAHYGAEKLGCTVVPVSGGMTERQVQLINDFEPLLPELVEDRQHVARRHHNDVGLEFVDELHLPLGHPAGNRHHRAAELFRAVMRAQAAGEQAIAIGVMHDH